MATNHTAPKTPGLALSVLSLLLEGPMHPYEMKLRMKDRGHDQVIRLRGGSLYDTVDRLHQLGLIQPGETEREGRRPERTVYAITDAGRDELRSWVRQLLAEPVHEYPVFTAALAFILTLDKDEAVGLLRRRIMAVEGEIAALDSVLHSMVAQGLPRIVLIEGEYTQAVRRAEVEWIGGLVREIEAGGLWPSHEQLRAAGERFDTRHKEEGHASAGESKGNQSVQKEVL